MKKVSPKANLEIVECFRMEPVQDSPTGRTKHRITRDEARRRLRILPGHPLPEGVHRAGLDLIDVRRTSAPRLYVGRRRRMAA